MDTLRLVEVTVDGDLVLMTGDGRRFSLSVDEQVRSAVRRSRNGTHVVPGPDRPGPREVQSRIRSGADAEQVAQQTGLDVDYVRRFEGPVLAERAHVADLARATPVDRGGDPTLTLERVVLDVLTNEGFDVDDIEWDSRRSDGSRWEVLAVSTVGITRTEATWAFDTATRSLEPVDDEAERLTGVERRRRLSAVRDSVFDVERPSAASPRSGTVDLLDALARQRGRRPVPATPGTTEMAPAADGSSAGGSPADGLYADERDADQEHVGEQPDAHAPDLQHPDERHLESQHADAQDPDARHPDPQDPDERHLDAQHLDARAAAGSDPGVTADGTAPDGERVRSGSHAAGGAREQGRDARPPAPAEGLRAVSGGSSDDPGQAGEPDLLSELGLDRTAQPRTTPPRPAPSSVSAGRSKRRRSAVPSWDEIVFGAKRQDG